MDQRDDDAWSISLLVPASGAPTPGTHEDPVVDHALRDYIPGLRQVVRIDGRRVQDQWDRTVNTLLRLGDSIGSAAQDWEIGEIEVGLTLSAKGELLFIAEAGAEASVKFVLKKKPSSATR